MMVSKERRSVCEDWNENKSIAHFVFGYYSIFEFLLLFGHCQVVLGEFSF